MDDGRRTPTTATDQRTLMIQRLRRLATALQRTYRITALVHEEHRPFPLLEAIGADGRRLIMAGTAHYWWYGDAPRVIGSMADTHGVARRIAEQLKAARR